MAIAELFRRRYAGGMRGGLLILSFVGVASCAACSQPRQPASESKSSASKLVLYVSNQSSAIPEVDIAVSIDGKQVVNSSFSIGMGHNFIEHSVALSPGAHTIHAISRRGSAEYQGTIQVRDTLWASLDYWFQPNDGKGMPVERSFTFRSQERPLQFL
jgi:hypothetical protein